MKIVFQVIVANREFTMPKDAKSDHAEEHLAAQRTATGAKTLIGPPARALALKRSNMITLQDNYTQMRNNWCQPSSDPNNARPSLLSPRDQINNLMPAYARGEWVLSPHEVKVSDGLLSLWDQIFATTSAFESDFDGNVNVPISLLFNLALSLSVPV